METIRLSTPAGPFSPRVERTRGSQVKQSTFGSGPRVEIARLSVPHATDKFLGGAGAAFSVYGVATNPGFDHLGENLINGVTSGAYVGSRIAGRWGVCGGAVFGFVSALAAAFFSTGKDSEQIQRDVLRRTLRDFGFLDSKWRVTLADGSLYDLGSDGQSRLRNFNGTSRLAYEVDHSNPLSSGVVELVTPISTFVTGNQESLAQQFSGYLTNAALSNVMTFEEAKRNVEHFRRLLDPNFATEANQVASPRSNSALGMLVTR